MTNQEPCKHSQLNRYTYCNRSGLVFRGTCAKCGEAHESPTWEAVRIAFGRAPRRKFCVWKNQDDYDFYAAECGNSFQFNDGGPSDNGFKYCPYCGLRIKGGHDE